MRVERLWRVADGVDARVHPVQRAFAHPPRDGGTVEPAVGELIDTDQPVLPRGHVSYPPVGRRRVDSCTRSDTHSTHPLPQHAVWPIDAA